MWECSPIFLNRLRVNHPCRRNACANGTEWWPLIALGESYFADTKWRFHKRLNETNVQLCRLVELRYVENRFVAFICHRRFNWRDLQAWRWRWHWFVCEIIGSCGRYLVAAVCRCLCASPYSIHHIFTDSSTNPIKRILCLACAVRSLDSASIRVDAALNTRFCYRAHSQKTIFLTNKFIHVLNAPRHDRL